MQSTNKKISTFYEKKLDRTGRPCYTKYTYAGSFFALIFHVSEKELRTLSEGGNVSLACAKGVQDGTKY